MNDQRRLLFGVVGIAQRSIDGFVSVIEEAARDGEITADEYPALVAWGEKVRSDIDRVLEAARPESTADSSANPSSLAALLGDPDARNRAGEGGLSR